ncbi:Exo_endo_phos domain-containing protein, partial [Cephalotus follicularis]
QEIWTLLWALHGQMHKLWVFIGDFNEILRLSEKHGGGMNASWQIDQFRNALHDCGLVDMRCEGSGFTWNNGRRGLDFISARLDRSVCNWEWKVKFPMAVMFHTLTSILDHCAIVLCSQGRCRNTGCKRQT